MKMNWEEEEEEDFKMYKNVMEGFKSYFLFFSSCSFFVLCLVLNENETNESETKAKLI